jgi:hypothetical protein
MPNSSKPALDVWDSCCIIGILNAEQDKLPALLAQTRLFETGSAVLGVPSTAVTEVFKLSDGTSAEAKIQEFLDNPYVQFLQSTREVVTLSSRLQFRFNSNQIPDLKAKAIAAGVPGEQANKLGSRDSEILASGLVYKADRLTTYDPFLIFLGNEYIYQESGLIISPPSCPFLPFPETSEPKETASLKPLGGRRITLKE